MITYLENPKETPEKYWNQQSLIKQQNRKEIHKILQEQEQKKFILILNQQFIFKRGLEIT